MKKKAAIISLSLLVLLALPLFGALRAQKASPRLAQVVYITLSKACSCMLVLCQAGDIVVENVFNGERKGLLKRIDYVTDKETAKVYIKKYRVTQAPALLFLDAQGNLLWMRAGELSESEIAVQLSQFGG